VQGIGNIIDTVMHYSIMETQYKVDIVKALTDAFRKRHMGIGFYFCNTDWNDLNQRFDERNLYYDSSYTLATHPEGYRAAIERQTQLLKELCTNYGPVDQIDFDHGLPENLWSDVEKVIKAVRQLQPNALFRNRGLGNYGDFETPEHWIPDSPDDPRLSMLWQAIEHYGTRWAWQPNDTYKGKEWILQSLIDCASKGGNFMVGVSPMANGKFDQRTQDDLRWTGRWLQMNGEAIYATRGMFMKDDSFRFTRSKDSTIAYAIHTGWFNDRQVTIKNITARPGGSITMPGVAGSLQWRQNGSDLVINVPARKPDCEYAYVFRIPLR
jgi:alpha-L-fucosidase